ncbi:MULTISPECIES: pyruvate kinase [Bacillales]|uniref:Pyruvate kinase n=1 Tax=Lysinibacillus louembei TaxID=1470088 RepID=A0ABZ0RUX6_9BACI|nr:MULTISPECIES: pyruvate kinase [Bacillales]MCT6925633.1 pyruvate kinase [Metasolibacillus sp.]MCT6941788.1 pyruvate kinase [Metasolibacillus sp.]WPK10638.1 pyruvate kinase [Lysinibacillus louembei]
MRKTKIVCTIGPASESPEMLESLIKAGMNVARLNFSHGSHEEHAVRIAAIREAAKNVGQPVGILLDTKGPEIRTHTMENGELHLVTGQVIDISMTEVVGTSTSFSVTYSELINDVDQNDIILLDDGLIELRVLAKDIEKGLIHTIVENAGVLKNKKGVNVPGVSIKLPGITEKDAQDILFGIEQEIDFIAASFVRTASDVLEIRELLEQNNGSHIQIIPKIENQEGVDNIDEIIQVSDGLMVARGDLGVEIPAEEVPLVQKSLISKCNHAAKPVITATQMLDSMQRNPRPTRAEASDVANAIIDGTDAIMLSGETAAGLYPLESVQTMNKIAERTEQSLDYRSIVSKHSRGKEANMTEAISQAVAYTSLNLGIKAVLAPTESGNTAKMIAKYRPGVHIVAVTGSKNTAQLLTLVWGVKPILCQRAKTTDEILELSVDESLKHGFVDHGDVVVITAGVPVGEAGTTNLMKVHVIGDLLARGQGVGKASVVGKALVANNAAEALAYDAEGAILVTIGTDREMMPAIEKCAGIITEEGGLTSHAAVVGLSLGIPVIVGVKDALELIRQGQEITMDAETGVIYKGHASVL